MEDYKKTNVIKIIVQDSKGKILLFQESLDHDWMPGHWGLPGGKANVRESLLNAIKRLTKEEVGVDINPLGIFRIEELLNDNETILIYNVVALLTHPEDLKTQRNTKWVELNDIEKMKVEEFTEFFNKKLLLDYLKSDRGLTDFNLIETQEYYDLHGNPEYKRWLESGKKNVE
jgi:8-oxo-dGTP diphosphatase